MGRAGDSGQTSGKRVIILCNLENLGSRLPDVHQQRLFLQEYIHNFMHVGAVLPSSPVLGRAAAAYVTRKRGPTTILEAGAGTGSFTSEIVPHLQPGDRFDVVEINPTLMAYLQRRLTTQGAFSNPRIDIRLIQADLLNFPFDTKYDFIVFSLPLTIFPPQMVQEVLEIMMDHLQPGGIFSYVRYALLSRLRHLLGSPVEQAKLCARQSIIDSFAACYQMGQHLVWANMPPTWVYYWQSPSGVAELSRSDSASS